MQNNSLSDEVLIVEQNVFEQIRDLDSTVADLPKPLCHSNAVDHLNLGRIVFLLDVDYVHLLLWVVVFNEFVDVLLNLAKNFRRKLSLVRLERPVDFDKTVGFSECDWQGFPCQGQYCRADLVTSPVGTLNEDQPVLKLRQVRRFQARRNCGKDADDVFIGERVSEEDNRMLNEDRQ